MKIKYSLYELIIESSSGDYGYHAGDLKYKAETLGSRNFMIGRTGHMGTGYYFYGNLDDAMRHATGTDAPEGEFHEERPIMAVDFSKYNLLDARKFAEKYYDLIKEITLAAVKLNPEDINEPWFNEAIEELQKELNGVGITLSPESIANILYGFTKDIKEKSNRNAEMLGSRLAKAVGYEGVDVRGSNLDNFGVGSIIFDIKPGTVKKIKV